MPIPTAAMPLTATGVKASAIVAGLVSALAERERIVGSSRRADESQVDNPVA